MKVRIGTRKSKLALIQSELAADAIKQAYPDAETELIYYTTKGDVILDKPLEKLGGKGVFISEIEQALQSGDIDIAVHSAKDLPLELAEGTRISAVLRRSFPNDVLVTRRNEVLKGGVIGTSSTRRADGVRKLFPDTTTADIRGNVDTRLNKLAEGQYDGIILAAAGLSRLGALGDKRFDYTFISTKSLVPAPCQGIIAIQSGRDDIAELLSGVSDNDTYKCFETERAVLELLNAGCSSPVGALAEIKDGIMTLTVTKDQHTILIDSAPAEERFELVKRLVSEL